MRFERGRLAVLLLPLLTATACTWSAGLGNNTQVLDQRMWGRLTPDIAAGRVTVQQANHGVTVAFTDDSLFAPGSAALNEAGSNVVTGVIQGLLDPWLMGIQIAEPAATPGSLQAARVQTVTQFFADAGLGPAIVPPVPAQAVPPGPAGKGLTITVTVIPYQMRMGGGAAASPPVSFDGRYEGSVQVTGAANGVDTRNCATDPRFSFLVSNNEFRYSQPHPNVAGSTPGLIAMNTTTVYEAIIGSNGSIKGTSGDIGGTIEGTVSGTHMTGTISGLACYYKFTADRV